eukprot:TRINITY_DN42576_c0_g1_i5.p1 TRINITY_DN42576_c0_g1~~TRINITY_DN42576_c0_g1_i5.p1  ORF type:complete len:172 (+),score=24.45 TRINITY_DN42576_c0_g1_i5:323-838(+)
MASSSKKNVCDGTGKERKKRVVNFSDGELRVLLEHVKEHNYMLFAALDGTAVTAKKKTKCWEIVTAHVNARGVATRTTKQIKKKWFDVKSQALKIRSKAKNPPTGGGAQEDEPWYVDVVLDINGENSCLLDGIKGKFKSFAFSDFQTERILRLKQCCRHKHTNKKKCNCTR